jgi:hypothetical protein
LKRISLPGPSGKFNNQIIFKQYGEETVLSKYPDMSAVVPSVAQKKEKTRFAMAMDYAKVQMADPALKTAYKAKAKGMQRPHNVAIKDYYNPPYIESISLEKLDQGIIQIVAFDDFRVSQVDVQIFDRNGVVLETGKATQLSSWNWTYLIQNPTVRFSSIIATAIDLPGNKGSKEMIISD